MNASREAARHRSRARQSVRSVRVTKAWLPIDVPPNRDQTIPKQPAVAPAVRESMLYRSIPISRKAQAGRSLMRVGVSCLDLTDSLSGFTISSGGPAEVAVGKRVARGGGDRCPKGLGTSIVPDPAAVGLRFSSDRQMVWWLCTSCPPWEARRERSASSISQWPT